MQVSEKGFSSDDFAVFAEWFFTSDPLIKEARAQIRYEKELIAKISAARTKAACAFADLKLIFPDNKVRGIRGIQFTLPPGINPTDSLCWMEWRDVPHLKDCFRDRLDMIQRVIPYHKRGAELLTEYYANELELMTRNIARDCDNSYGMGIKHEALY